MKPEIKYLLTPNFISMKPDTVRLGPNKNPLLSGSYPILVRHFKQGGNIKYNYFNNVFYKQKLTFLIFCRISESFNSTIILLFNFPFWILDFWDLLGILCESPNDA